MANEGPFLFYSALHGRPVRDPDGNVVGRLDDLAVTLTETFPAATALLVRRGRVESFRLTARWRDVESVDLAAVRLRVPDERLVPGRRLPSEPSFWVGQALLDRQIVDTSGAKVVRVNDLHFLHVPTGDLHLVHVDVGFRGLVRRLGWSTTMGKEQLISWRYVQPLTLAATGESLQLTVARKELGRLHPAELADLMTELDCRDRRESVTLPSHLTAAEALERLRGLAREVELIYYIYLVDPAARLQGVVTIRHLLLFDPAARLEEIMRRDPVSVRPDDTPERVAEITEKYNLLAVPVLDAQGTLLGVLPADDV